MRMRKLATLVATSALLFWTIGISAQTVAPPAVQPQPAAARAMPAECERWVAKPVVVSSLKEIKRVYVDVFGDDPVSAQIQAMVVTQLLQSGKFVVTENRQKADAFLKGAGVEKTSVESHSYESGTAAGRSSGGYSGSIYGASGGFSSAGAAINDASSSSETVNDARVSVRLVNQDGDVLWATTQESKGAKYKGASADVADKVVKQLIRDIEKAGKTTALSETAATK
jgi:curli biogenesis system outer membrane secretion channel CsgG